jgi:hypothetical protein
MDTPNPPAPAPDAPATPRLDLLSGLGWIALGLAIFIGSWRMDRLESQGASLWTLPGLVPGLYGVVIVVLGTLLTLRAVRQGAMTTGLAPRARDGRRGRVALALVLMLGYALLALGRVPFALATAIFVFAFIVAFDRDRGDGPRPWRQVLVLATSCAIGAALVITLVFQHVFLVRLP